MIALELYRQRIGIFRSKLTSNKCLDVKLSNCLSREQISCLKTIYILCAVGLCLALLCCHMEERENVGWQIILGTSCHGILCFIRSVCEQYLHDDLKGDMLDNVIWTLKFRNYFDLFSYGLTKEQKYQMHDNSEAYTLKEPVYVDNATYTPEPVDVTCTVDRHGTASYLLGNSGQHAYNGNPPRRRSESDTPSTSTEEKIKHLHYTMINELDGHLSSNIRTEWRTFTGFLRVHLQPRDIEGVTTMFEVCDTLERRGVIKYGEYDKLKKLFSDIKNQPCIDIVDRYSTQMKEVETQQASPDTSRNRSVYTESVVKSWKEDDKLCYETKGVKAVKEKICNQSCVCVIGVPGSGKSTAILHAALHIQETSQYRIYLIKSPKEVKKHMDKELEQDRDKKFGLLFVIDDIIGEHFVDKEKLDLWDSYNDEIRRCLEVNKNVKILTSLRLQLYSDEKLKGKTYIFNDPNNKVNFSDKDFKLSLDDMKSMLRHYLEVRNVDNTEALIEEICGSWWWKYGWEDWGWAAQSADCFPLLCKVFSDNKSVRESPKKFFTAPFPALTDIFRQIKSKNKHQFCGLLLCAFTELVDDYFKCEYPHDKPKIFTSLIKSQNLDPEGDLEDIESALQALDGVYISHVGNKYDFKHSTFRDITTFLYENKYVIFQHATRDFIKSRVRLFSKLSEDDDYVLVFGEDCVELLANRMIHELKCQTWWVGAGFIVYNRYIDDDRVVNGLCTKLFDSQDTDITQDMVDVLFKRCTEAVWGYCRRHSDDRDVMSWPCYKLLMKMFSSFDCTRQKYVIFQHARCGFINSRVRLFSKLREDDDYVLVLHGEDCVELLTNRMIHELKCDSWRGARFIVGNRYIDDERVVNGLCTKLFDSQDTDITQDKVDVLFEKCLEAVWWYCEHHRDNRDEMSLPCYKLLVRLIPRVDCARQVVVFGETYPVLECVGTGSVSLTKLVVQQNNVDINAVDGFDRSVLHLALMCGNNVEITRYLLGLPNLTRLNHRDGEHRTPYGQVVQDRDWRGNEIANRQDMMDMYKQAGAID